MRGVFAGCCLCRRLVRVAGCGAEGADDVGVRGYWVFGGGRSELSLEVIRRVLLMMGDIVANGEVVGGCLGVNVTCG